MHLLWTLRAPLPHDNKVKNAFEWKEAEGGGGELFRGKFLLKIVGPIVILYSSMVIRRLKKICISSRVLGKFDSNWSVIHSVSVLIDQVRLFKQGLTELQEVLIRFILL